jgi:hypothetical protein
MSEKSDTNITYDEIIEALSKSGYLLENRLEKILIRKKFVLSPNDIYPDPFENKSREIDLSATKSYIYGDEENIIWLDLIIECINNYQPMAFFTRPPKFENYYPYEELKIISRPDTIGNEILKHYLRIHKYHHYYKGDIATQWCSFQKKKQSSSEKEKWMAFHYDDFHKTFQKLCFATQYQITDYLDIFKDFTDDSIQVHMIYPIFVAQNKIYSVKTEGDISLSNANHIKYLKTEYVKGRFTWIRIDVVTEKFFPKLIDIIEDEFQKTSQLIEEKSDILKNEFKKVIPI